MICTVLILSLISQVIVVWGALNDKCEINNLKSRVEILTNDNKQLSCKLKLEKDKNKHIYDKSISTENDISFLSNENLKLQVDLNKNKQPLISSIFNGANSSNSKQLIDPVVYINRGTLTDFFYCDRSETRIRASFILSDFNIWILAWE